MKGQYKTAIANCAVHGHGPGVSSLVQAMETRVEILKENMCFAEAVETPGLQRAVRELRGIIKDLKGAMANPE